MLIEYYEILHREKTQAVGFACNSKLYPMKHIIENNKTEYYIIKSEQKVIVDILNSTKNIKNELIFLDVPQNIIDILEQKEKLLLISAEPTNYPEEEAPNFEFFCLINKKI